MLHIGKDLDEFTYTMTARDEPVELEYTKEEKDLGVIIDNTLSFEHHCDTAITKANRILGIIRRS